MSKPIAENMQIDETLFKKRLEQEMQLLARWFAEKKFADQQYQAGFEVEYSLIDKECRAASKNLALIDLAHFLRIVPELDRSEVEINSEVVIFNNKVFSSIHGNLNGDFLTCMPIAEALDVDLIAIGTLPNSSLDEYNTDTHTDSHRYNIIIGNMPSENQFYPLLLEGKEELQLNLPHYKSHGNAFQIHFRINLPESVRHYNAAVALMAPILSACTNSPFMCRKHIAADSRIIFYEKMWRMSKTAQSNEPKRCMLTKGYAQQSLLEIFDYIAENYRCLLPVTDDTPPEEMNHVLMQSGCVYHWIRPILDFGPSGNPHIRLEFRPLSSGPTHVDMVANAALFFGLIHYYAKDEIPLERQLPFELALHNFYEAANKGLDATLLWIDGKEFNAADLLLNELLPKARHGLNMLNCDPNNYDYYLDIIENRVKSRQTGSDWQLQFIAKHPYEFDLLVKQYIALQKTDQPVHTWPIK